jgi:hypothetical protein
MKFNYRNKIIAVFAGLAIIAAPGCKKFLDVNDSPNSPKTATEELLLPSTQAAIGMVVGNPLQIFGSIYAQYWTQSPFSSQYKTIDQYQSNPSDFNRVWGILYNDALRDITVLEQSKKINYVAIALIEKAYIFQLLTDAFGDVPLKGALQGLDNLSPNYDSQEEVYDSIFAWTKRGIALTTVSAVNYPGKDDLVFGGGEAGMENWKEFGNTLLLRAYLRLSEVAPEKAQAGIQELYATNPAFLTTDAKIQYQNVGGNQNPLYAEGVALQRTANLVASETAVNAYEANNDPRKEIFYLKNAAVGEVVGIPQGSFGTQPDVNPSFPAPVTGARFRIDFEEASSVAPVKLMTAAEAYLLQAEAVAREWAPAGNTNELFLAGIKASFDAYEIPEADYTTYITTSPAAQLPADKQGMVKAIITQKYYAMNGNQGFEAWTEWRRTGYPDFLVVSQASSLGTNQMPARLLYPETEITRNSNFPGVKLITDKVWWDKP